MSVNLRLTAIQIIGQRKAFYRQSIPESSCARKETVDIDILVKSRNSDRKIIRSIRIRSRPPPKNKEVEPAEPVQMNIYQSSAYRKDLSWLHFDDQPRVQDKQQVKDQQACISILQLIQQFQVATTRTSPNMTTVLHPWPYGRFMEIQSNLRRKNFIEQIKVPIFLEAVSAREIM